MDRESGWEKGGGDAYDFLDLVDGEGGVGEVDLAELAAGLVDGRRLERDLVERGHLGHLTRYGRDGARQAGESVYRVA